MGRMKELKMPLGIPPFYSSQYLWDAFFIVGPTQSGVNGIESLEWHNVVPFADFTKMLSEPWEAKLMIDMSAAYIEGFRAGSDPLSIQPIDWEDEDE